MHCQDGDFNEWIDVAREAGRLRLDAPASPRPEASTTSLSLLHSAPTELPSLDDDVNDEAPIHDMPNFDGVDSDFEELEGTEHSPLAATTNDVTEAEEEPDVRFFLAIYTR